MAKTNVRTLKGIGWCKDWKEQETKILASFKGYVPLPILYDNFQQYSESYNKDKLIIKAWYYRGEWSEPTLEVYQRYYKVK